jgi:tripartite-type tricarboxylate transporter receptor subunit TctC
MRAIDRRSFVVAGAAAAAAPLAWAQGAYPSAKAIRYLVPVPAGGGADMIARATTERLAKVLGQSITVDNIAGGSGVIASQTTARAAPDGYTLIQAYVATHGTSPATRKLPFDPLKDFTPIGMIGTAPNVLCINPGVPTPDVKSFIAYARARPGKLAYGSAGAGTLTHLVGELFKLQTNIFMTHIPYRGAAPAIVDLIAGQTQASFPSLAGAAPHIRTGRIRPLAVTGPKRHPLFPDVPTFAESGLGGFDGEQWYGIMGPAGLPAPVVKTLVDALGTVLSQPDFQEKLSAEAVALRPMTPEVFAAYVKADIERWTKVARERKLDLES